MAKYKKRKDGRYCAQIQIGNNPETGKRKFKTIYGRTQRELDEKVTEFKTKFYKGIIIDDKNLTVKDWGDNWLSLFKQGKEYRTRQMYIDMLNRYIYPAIGLYKIKDIKTYHIQELVNSMHSKGLTRSIEMMLLTLNQIFKKAIKPAKLIYENPVEDVEVPSFQKAKKRALTTEEMKYIIEADLTEKQRAFLYTLLFSGARRGEALALGRNDINSDEQQLAINKTESESKDGSVIKPYTKSSSGMREVWIPKVLVNVLEQYKKSSNSPYMFPTAKNESLFMSKSSFNKFWKGIMNQLQLVVDKINEDKADLDKITLAKDISPHIFRHTYATLIYHAGVDIKEAQYRLGHSSIVMTMDIYTHFENSHSGMALYNYMVETFGDPDFINPATRRLTKTKFNYLVSQTSVKIVKK